MKKQLSLRNPGVYLVVAILLTFMVSTILTSCSSSSALGEMDLDHGIISGYVVKSSGGSPVAGSTITAEGATVTTTATKEDGSYSMNLHSGNYNLTANKTGFAQSRIENVFVFAKQAYTGVDFVQFPVFNPELQVGAPEIEVYGISDGTLVEGQTCNIGIHATGVNPIRRINVRIGSLTGPPHFYVNDKDELNFTWNSSDLIPPPDNSFIHVVVYDINFNRTERFIYIKTPEGIHVDLPAPEKAVAVSHTFNSDLEYLSYRSQETAKSKLTVMESGQKLPDLANIDLRGVGEDTTIYCGVEWLKVSEAVGYKISRAEGGGQYKLLGNVFQYEPVPKGFIFYDFSPELTPGKTYVYKIEPYTKKGFGSEILTQPITILGRFEVELVYPGNLAINVPVKPTFTWNIIQNAGQDQFFEVFVRGINDEEDIKVGFVENETSLESEVTLENNKAYEWGFSLCMAVGDWNEEFDTYLARSYSAPDRLSATSGTHTFVTVP